MIAQSAPVVAMAPTETPSPQTTTQRTPQQFASVGPVLDYTIPENAVTYDYSDDDSWEDEEWDDSACATSGATATADPVAPQPVIAQPVAPQPAIAQPVAPLPAQTTQGFSEYATPTFSVKELDAKFHDEIARVASLEEFAACAGIKKAGRYLAPIRVPEALKEKNSGYLVAQCSDLHSANADVDSVKFRPDVANVTYRDAADYIRMTAHIGSGNPGLFVSANSQETLVAYRPGSIGGENAQEPTPALTRKARPRREEATPETIDARPLPTETAPQEAPEALAARESEDVDLWTQLEKEWQALVARTDGLVAGFVSVATIEKEYDDPILVAVATEAPLEEDFDDDEDWDDSAFAVSGAVQEPIAAAPVLATPVSSPSVPSNQVSPEQSAPRYVALNTTPANSSTPSSAGIPSTRKSTTPEERLEAAKRAGAQIVELSPEQYRHAVAKGLGTVPQGR